MKIIGIDLAGPANHKDTVMTIFEKHQDQLVFESYCENASDSVILSTIRELASTHRVIVGMDAPLSYQDGGGDRPQDKEMRNLIKSYGMLGSSIMPPTLTRMVYLTLRGIALTRSLRISEDFPIEIVEVHPGAAIGTRIDPAYLKDVLMYKRERTSREVMFHALVEMGLVHLPMELVESSHRIDSCAAALAAWHWVDENKQPVWCWNKTCDRHPYECCC
ncbi:DUF429 domain-containing protein [Bacillus weihaiensis]|uniref:DUF429 domain-containing protein n=1 Tax=Bacillus weihaiensis TaxID=1547283 RepID=A0A1L3MVQ7_9BACI|nr:DUF429 domain-containing protein [Bacillus weihaiensis]APH06423.1 hypothetical protein A9C19_17725 [Bacillus weihaiensis]